jgi:hypothetical protein
MPPWVLVQSESDRQATHWFEFVSHAGAVGSVHWAELVQPARHVPLPPQMGVAPLQSAFDPHCTHAWSVEQ